LKISGFSIVRNSCKYNYPVCEAIQAVLPICDEFIVNVGDSEDGTLELVQSLREPKIRIIRARWEAGQKPDLLSYQTNLALKECRGDWAFYVQADEIIHEEDLIRLKNLMKRHLEDGTDAFRFKWLHFFGSYYRYRIDFGWFQKQDRIVRNNGQIESCVDAWAFRRKDGKPLRIVKTDCLLYHYGWVQPGDVMTQRRVNAENIYAGPFLTPEERKQDYDYGDLNRFPAYLGSHPKVMQERIGQHALSRKDWQDIERRYWWHPAKWFRLRYKTFRRVKSRVQ
jgi:glycosyltransferase involved in cell wall biosynthesis